MPKMIFEADEEFFIPVPKEYNFAETIKFIAGRLKRKKTLLLKKAQEVNPNNPASPCIYYVENRGFGRLYRIRWQAPLSQAHEGNKGGEEDDWPEDSNYQDAIFVA